MSSVRNSLTKITPTATVRRDLDPISPVSPLKPSTNIIVTETIHPEFQVESENGVLSSPDLCNSESPQDLTPEYNI
jgi:hypothetical protein